MAGSDWEEDIKHIEEKWENENERQDDINIINLVDGVWNLYVDSGEIIH